MLHSVIEAGRAAHTPAAVSWMSDRYLALVDRVHEGTSLEALPFDDANDLGSILARTALNLQRVAGVPVDFSFGRARTPDHAYDVVVQYRHEVVGRMATNLSMRWLSSLLEPEEHTFDLLDEFGRFATVNETNDLGVMGRALAAAAAKRGIPTTIVDPRGRIIELGDGRYRQRLSGQVTSATPAISMEIARNKYLTNRYLRAAGLPVPESMTARSLASTLDAARTIGYPVVLKPIDQAASVGVALDLRDDGDVRAHFDTVKHASTSPKSDIVVERFVPGNDYRVLVVNDAIAAISQRVHPQVIGSGSHTIRELIEIENADPRRGPGPSHVYRRITVDERVVEYLAETGLTLDDVPPPGRTIVLMLSGSRQDGAIYVDVTDEIHPANAVLMRTATRVLGLDLAGIDVVTPDISQSMWKIGGAIIEINDNSAFNLHLFPGAGRPRDPGPAIIDMLFPSGQPFRASVVAVVAHGESESLCQAVAAALADQGRAVGLATSAGIAVDGQRYPGVDGRNPDGPRTLLNNPLVEVAVVEVEPASIVERGLGFGACDVAVIPSLSGLVRPNGQPVETVLLDALDSDGLALFGEEAGNINEAAAASAIRNDLSGAATIAQIVNAVSPTNERIAHASGSSREKTLDFR